MPGKFNESMNDNVFYVEDEMKELFVQFATPQFRKMAIRIQKVNKNNTGSTGVAEARFVFDEMLGAISNLIHTTMLGVKQHGFMEVEMQENLGKIVRRYTEYGRKIARIYLCNAFPYMDATGDAAVEMTIDVSEFKDLREQEIVFDGNDVAVATDYFFIIEKHKKVAEKFTRELVVRLSTLLEPTEEDEKNVQNDTPTCANTPIPMLLNAIMNEYHGEDILMKAYEKYFEMRNRRHFMPYSLSVFPTKPPAHKIIDRIRDESDDDLDDE